MVMECYGKALQMDTHVIILQTIIDLTNIDFIHSRSMLQFFLGGFEGRRPTS